LTFLGHIQPRLAFGTVSAVRTDCGSITAAGGVAEIVGLRMSGLPGPPECLLSQSGGTTPDRRAGQAIGGSHSPEQRKRHGPWRGRARHAQTDHAPGTASSPAVGCLARSEHGGRSEWSSEPIGPPVHQPTRLPLGPAASERSLCATTTAENPRSKAA
jgi:hypothetical protein